MPKIARRFFDDKTDHWGEYRDAAALVGDDEHLPFRWSIVDRQLHDDHPRVEKS
ncbi:MAG TPA: hypothetical protein VH374_04870 [Polyangia bacterium]|jgi:hypothetical protein|nr:hypothetical protein [Polyangia bacterium]